jgi:hypothetical protein
MEGNQGVDPVGAKADRTMQKHKILDQCMGLFAQLPKRVYSSMGTLGMGKVGMTTGG